MKVGAVLRSIRLKKNISKNDVSKKTGFNNGYLYKIENDLIKPSLNSINLYAEAIGCPIWQIIYIAYKAEKLGVNYDNSFDTVSAWGSVAEVLNSGGQSDTDTTDGGTPDAGSLDSGTAGTLGSDLEDETD